ncbi:hypothetical protein [Saccharicrinis aurantiacus]|uniref:hypothetical protein n=1 Tax=Saccharicrinis aurantiacus TaxID=1849719 RepID=UPI00249182BE|nr:hypothetical protein [Saccharicrinis aurantiacus]
MKKINHKIAWVLSLALVLLWSCNDEYEIPSEEPNHSFIKTSFGTGQNYTQIYESFDLIDLSRGVSSREWTFPEGVVLDADSTFITTSDESVVKVRFTKPGEYKIPLAQKFNGPVYAQGEQLDVDEFNTELTITIVDSVKASFTATDLKTENVFENKNGALNEVLAGRPVVFEYGGTGEPNEVQYNFVSDAGVLTSYKGDTISHRFISVGTYDMQLVAKNEWSVDTILYMDYVKVLANTEDPILLLSTKNTKEKRNQITLEFDSELNDVSTCPTSAFVLDVTNGSQSIGVSVSSITQDADLKNIVYLNLNQDLYSSDNVVVNYDDAVGNLESVSYTKVETFAADVEFIRANILEGSGFDYSFETTTNDDWNYLWWGAPWDAYTMDITDAKAYSGAKSSYIVMEPGGGMIAGQKTGDVWGQFELKAGVNYRVSCWVYVEDLGAINDPAGVDLRYYWATSTDWSVPGCPVFNDEFPVGKWVYSSFVVASPGAGLNSFQIRGNNQGNGGQLKVYLDEIGISETEDR